MYFTFYLIPFEFCLPQSILQGKKVAKGLCAMQEKGNIILMRENS